MRLQRISMRMRSERKKLQLISIVSGAAIVLSASQVHAWKPSMHVQLTENARTDAADDNKVTIYKTDYGACTTSELPGNKLGDFAVNTELVDAISTNPSVYQAGVIGPDAFPDLLTGQQNIHPATKAWFGYLWDKANALPAGNAKKAALAFVGGFLAHGAGDMFGHTFINYFNGAAVNATGDDRTGDFTFTPPSNAIRHVVSEAYAAKKGPAPANRTISLDGGAKDFIIKYMIDIKRPNNGSQAWPDRTRNWDADDELYCRLWQNKTKADGETYENCNGFTDGARAEHTDMHVPAHLAWRRKNLKREIVWYYDGKAGWDAEIAAGNIFQKSYRIAAKGAFMSTWGPVASYEENWFDDIDKAIDKLPEFSLTLAQKLMINHPLDATGAHQAAEDYALEYLLPALGSPKVFSYSASVVNRVVRYLGDWPVVRQIKDGMLNFLLKTATKMDKDQWKEYASEEITEAAFDKVMDPANGDTIGDIPLLPPPNAVRIRNGAFKSDELKMGMMDAQWDYKKFPAAFNTVQMIKMTMLSPAGMTALATALGYNLGPARPHGMLDFIRNLDGSQRWWRDPPRMFTAVNFCAHKQIFMRQSGETTAPATLWPANCP
jgi:hypothetical protein